MHRLESLAEEAVSFDAYWQEIADTPSLSVDDELKLGALVAQHDERAVTELARSQLALVVRCARPYARLGVPLVELVRDGNLALIEAARRFRPGRAGRFAVQAVWWVRQGMLHRVTQGAGAADDEGRRQLVAAIGAAVDAACAGGEPAARALTPHDVRTLDAQWRPNTPPRSAAGDDELDLDGMAPLAAAADDHVRRALVSELEASLFELEPKERRALEVRLRLADGEPRPVDLMGMRLRMSSARAERLSLRAVAKLRRQRAWRAPLN